jgi:hypothetical protein
MSPILNPWGSCTKRNTYWFGAVQVKMNMERGLLQPTIVLIVCLLLLEMTLISPEESPMTKSSLF